MIKYRRQAIPILVSGLLVTYLCLILSCRYATNDRIKEARPDQIVSPRKHSGSISRQRRPCPERFRGSDPPQAGSRPVSSLADSVSPKAFFIKPDTVSIEKDNVALVNTVKLTGETNLPDRSIITVIFYYIAYHTQNLIGIRKGAVKDKGWSVEFGPYQGALPSGDYKFTIEFNPDKQYKEVKQILGMNISPISQTFHKQFGTPEDVERERNELLNNIKLEVKNLHHLYLTLKDKFYNSIKVQKGWDKSAWQEWLKQYHAKIDKIIEISARQDELGVFKSVLWAKFQLEKLSSRLEQMGELCDKALTDPKRDSACRYEYIIKELDNLNERFEQVMDKLGLGQSLNKTGLVDTIKELESLLDVLSARLKANIKQGTVEKDYPDWLAQKHNQAGQLVLNLSGQFPASEYAKVAEISRQVLDLLECLEKGKIGNKQVCNKFKTVREALRKNLTSLKEDYSIPSK